MEQQSQNIGYSHIQTSEHMLVNDTLVKVLGKLIGWEFHEVDMGGYGKITGLSHKGVFVSVPHLSHCAMQCPASEKAEAYTWLINNWFPAHSIHSWEIRDTVAYAPYATASKVISYLQLHDGEKEILQALPSGIRHKISKAQRNGFEIRTGKEELAVDFYKIYAQSMHRLGSPAMPQQFFAGLAKEYPQSVIIIAWRDKQPAGAAFMLWNDDFAEVCWLATNPEYNRLYLSYLLYWESMRIAMQKNCTLFSFGRSSIGSGVHTYKKRWGTAELNLYWNASARSTSLLRRLPWLTFIWKKLPFVVVNFIGPKIAKWLY